MTVIKHANQRVGVFLDVQNLYHSAKNLYDARVNFESVVKNIVSERTLIRAIAYVIRTESGDETAFLDALVNMGIETKSKDLQIFSDNAKKADWDVGLAVDIVSLAPKLDVIALVSGDGDFVPALEYVKKFGCQVEVVAFGKTCSQRLVGVADDFTDLCSSARKYLIRI
ncbi:MAG: NYN domain-containing protein [Candidatus Kaiserbacteria bacterium]|nr:NYN domain-containing protein [Candidatus Kaiserbacteria bacterium]